MTTPTSPDATHNPSMLSWVASANDPASDYPIQNLPLCSFHAPGDDPEVDPARVGVLIGDQVVSLRECVDARLFDDLECDDGEAAAVSLVLENLDGYCSLPSEARTAIRARLQSILAHDNHSLRDNPRLLAAAMSPASGARFHRPTSVPNYSDFYASIHHASTVGAMFRPDNPLLPNYTWVPIGYHGRASSVIISGTRVKRPSGQVKADDAAGTFTPPTFGPSQMLDYELEVGFVIGPGNPLGEPISIDRAEDHIAGVCLVNDWSARDIQKWEYQPLGPFLAKSFATSVSPALVTLDALAPFRTPAPSRGKDHPQPLGYLASEGNAARGGIALTLEVLLASARMRREGISPHRLSMSGAFKDLYWTMAQMVTHHASNGCNLTPGDLIASGTVSGSSPSERGCLLELTWQGRGPDSKPLPRKPMELPTGEKRAFLQDGDEVIVRGWCERAGFRRIGLGECRGVVGEA